MEKKELKVGDYVRGFKYESNAVCSYMRRMDKNVGQIGIVIDVKEKHVVLYFGNNNDNQVWLYPKDEALEHRAGNNDTTYTVSDLKFDYGFYKNENKSSNIDYGKIEYDPLDSLPLIGDGVLMEGSDDGEDWCVQNIIGKLKDGRYISFDVNGFSSWQYCRPIPKTKITRKEFESKFEIID